MYVGTIVWQMICTTHIMLTYRRINYFKGDQVTSPSQFFLDQCSPDSDVGISTKSLFHTKISDPTSPQKKVGREIGHNNSPPLYGRPLIDCNLAITSSDFCTASAITRFIASHHELHGQSTGRLIRWWDNFFSFSFKNVQWFRSSKIIEIFLFFQKKIKFSHFEFEKRLLTLSCSRLRLGCVGFKCPYLGH